VLRIAGADVISDQIANAALKSALEESAQTGNGDGAATNDPAQLVRYLELAYNISALPAARTIIESSHDPEVLAACLRLLKSAEDLPVVRACLSHEDSCVRVQAAAALGRIGEDDDEDRLVPLLSDREWWVRYRAAQALSRLPHMRELETQDDSSSAVRPFRARHPRASNGRGPPVMTLVHFIQGIEYVFVLYFLALHVGYLRSTSLPCSRFPRHAVARID
jgi:hypothetical protein